MYYSTTPLPWIIYIRIYVSARFTRVKTVWANPRTPPITNRKRTYYRVSSPPRPQNTRDHRWLSIFEFRISFFFGNLDWGPETQVQQPYPWKNPLGPESNGKPPQKHDPYKTRFAAMLYKIYRPCTFEYKRRRLRIVMAEKPCLADRFFGVGKMAKKQSQTHLAYNWVLKNNQALRFFHIQTLMWFTQRLQFIWQIPKTYSDMNLENQFPGNVFRP